MTRFSFTFKSEEEGMVGERGELRYLVDLFQDDNLLAIKGDSDESFSLFKTEFEFGYYRCLYPTMALFSNCCDFLLNLLFITNRKNTMKITNQLLKMLLKPNKASLLV